MTQARGTQAKIGCEWSPWPEWRRWMKRLRGPDGQRSPQRLIDLHERVLASLDAGRTGDAVVMGNLGSHNARAGRRLIRAAAAHVLFLPPYSPNFNPIEHPFARLKALRKARAHTPLAISEALADILRACHPDECANYVRDAEYASG